MNREKVISQVNQIIDLLTDEDRAKIPKSVLDFFEKNASNKEEYIIDTNIPLSKQQFDKETLDVLLFIYSYIK